MADIKHLANCKPTEFLAQTAKIRRSAESWLKATDIMNIRKIAPVFTDGMSDEEKKEAIRKQASENLIKMFDAVAEENAEKTLELLALTCFIDPKDVDEYPISYYFTAITEMLMDDSVMGFFSLLLKLDKLSISNVLKRSV